jgi:arginyl-tRNA synthetase
MLNNVKRTISHGFKELFDFEISPSELGIEVTNKQFDGEFTFVVFPYLRHTKKKPEETAELLGNFLVDHSPKVQDFNVVKGFLNLTMSNEAWGLAIQYALESNEYGRLAPKEQKIMVEYSSPNTNKPLHLGHVRNNVLGFSVASILEYAGYEVVKANLINDRGIHICKSMLAYKKLGQGETPDSTGMKGDHLVGKYYVLFDKEYRKEMQDLMASGLTEEEAEKKSQWQQETREMLLDWENGDPETMQLWNTLNGWVYKGFDASYERLGVSFDAVYKESETYQKGKEMVQEALTNGVLYSKEDGSIWADLTDIELDHKLLLRADGTSVYMTQDIATAEIKYNDHHMDKSVYVVGNEQDYHFKVLKEVLKKMDKGYADGIYHLSYGMVELPDGKLKTREGKVVDADNLMDEMYETAKSKTEEQGRLEGMTEADRSDLFEMLGLGALKYFLLKIDPVKRILFNPDESIDFQGNTGTFIQYTHARCNSILNQANQLPEIPVHLTLEKTEIEVLRHMYLFEAKVEEAAKDMSPAVMAQYIYDMAKVYNSFYNAYPILHEKDEDKRNIRILLTHLTAMVLRLGGHLLGMEMPKRM